MSVRRVLVPEGELLNILECASPLEWRRYQQRHPEVWVNGRFERVDCSGFPPCISFRFENESQAVIDSLKSSLNSYDGKVKWLLVEHQRESLPGINWIICPSRMVEVKDEAVRAGVGAGEYLAQLEPGFGPVAYEDFVKLTEYIRQSLFGVEKGREKRVKGDSH